jgi:hypothetical protein
MQKGPVLLLEPKPIAKAKRLNPNKKPHIARVEETAKGKPDKFRP